MQITIVVLILTAVFLIVYDIWAVLKYGIAGTISWQVWDKSRRFPIIPLAVGILVGHLFWRQEGPSSNCNPEKVKTTNVQ